MRATLSGDGSQAPVPTLTSERIAEELAELRAEHAEHAGQLADLRAENARLTAKVNQLDARRDAPENRRGSSAHRRRWRGPRTEVLDSPEPVSRRRVFGMLGSAAAAGAGLSLAGSALAADPAGATAVTAGAADGDALQIGGANTNTAGSGNGTVLSGSTTGPFSAPPMFRADQASTDPRASAILGSSTSVNGDGVVGHSVAATGDLGAGVLGFANTGLGLSGQGGRAPLLLVPAATAGAPTSGTHTFGELWVDTGGVLFQCVEPGEPGTWVRQAPLVPLASPVRVYDSRAGMPNQAPNVQGTLAFTSAPPSANNRVIRCAKDASSGVTVIPAGSTTLLLNLTAIAVSGVGALSVYADGATQPATSNLNWTAGGQVVANSVTSACDGSQDIRVAIPAAAGTGASTNFIVDLFGYYL